MIYASKYRDSLGQVLDRDDLVTVLGFDMTFRVVNMRPEGVAVIMNTAPGFTRTSTVPLRLITRIASAAALTEQA